MFTVEKQGAVDVIRCGVPLQRNQLTELQTAIHACLGHGQPLVVLDLTEAAFADGKGLETLLDLQDECERLGGSVKLASAGPLMEDVLRVTGVGDRFDAYPTVKAAIGSYSR